MFQTLDDRKFYATTFVPSTANFMDKSSFSPFQLLMEAVQHGCVDDVERLIPLCPSQNLNNMALWMAVTQGHNRCIKLLLPVSDPLDNNSGALAGAAARGNIEGVKILLPVSNPLDNNSYALMNAAANGHVECVKILLPVSDPMANKSWALCEAAKNGHQTCVDILAPVSDVHSVYATLEAAHPTYHILLKYMEEKIWELQQKRLTQEIDGVCETRSEKVRRI